MKILFAGPSIYGTSVELSDIELRAPASQGDLTRAVLEGATYIGLVDGNFEAVASVWHKEILYALQQGITVLGAASMGALRAAECARYGMVPIGKIAKEYATGNRTKDSDVALIHGPAEMGSPPLTVPIVDIESTLIKMLDKKIITQRLSSEILMKAHEIFFKRRTINALFSHIQETDFYSQSFAANFTSQKNKDAIELISFLKMADENHQVSSVKFQMQQPVSWSTAISDISKSFPPNRRT